MPNALAKVGGVVGTVGLAGILAFGTRHGRPSPVAALLGLGDGTVALVVSVLLLAVGVVLVDRSWDGGESED
ncbi:hypothetical protein ACFQJ5_04280 [Halomicroarcula sp. GCM10025324]|uniref:hypothetical protein n=1 Tax=Haloarcula TaxID=2237 RepID=UPI0023E8D6F5|nr:hypothetical protein [Halomicroarcula sp. ZS-22-S1]